VANLLSVNLGVSITEPRLKEHALTRVEVDATGKQILHAQVGDMLMMMSSASGVKKLGAVSLDALRLALSDASPPGEANYVLFRSALAATDPASRFLGLYQILALLNSDNQDQIDAFILPFISPQERNAKVTKTKPKKDGTFKDETIYTRLRNEYAHVRPGVSLAQTRKEMDANLSGLIAIVQVAIRRPSPDYSRRLSEASQLAAGVTVRSLLSWVAVWVRSAAIHQGQRRCVDHLTNS
jgi:hypothetical protein